MAAITFNRPHQVEDVQERPRTVLAGLREILDAFVATECGLLRPRPNTLVRGWSAMHRRRR